MTALYLVACYSDAFASPGKNSPTFDRYSGPLQRQTLGVALGQHGSEHRLRVCSFGTLTILKVTHHGSNTSSTPLFLSRFPPKVAVIQCGADNPYGHPTPETLERLQRVGAKVFRNDEDGDVIATIKDQELNVAVTKR